jgi:alpha-tubulin suppressor-like RCC1 family protein
MGQLGYSNKIISQMPKDREGYPFQVSFNFVNFSFFQPYPLEIESLKQKGIYQVAGGDGHTVAVDIKGNVYSWGARYYFNPT